MRPSSSRYRIYSGGDQQMKELRKKVTILFALLLSVIWFAILCLFVYSTYKNNLITLKDDIRMEIKECKWNNFLKSNGAYVDFDNIKYCVYSLDDSKKPHILFHTFPEASETQLEKTNKAKKELKMAKISKKTS